MEAMEEFFFLLFNINFNSALAWDSSQRKTHPETIVLDFWGLYLLWLETQTHSILRAQTPSFCLADFPHRTLLVGSVETPALKDGP